MRQRAYLCVFLGAPRLRNMGRGGGLKYLNGYPAASSRAEMPGQNTSRDDLSASLQAISSPWIVYEGAQGGDGMGV